MPAQAGIAFPESSYTIDLPENSTANSLVKSFAVVSNKLANEKFPLQCVITSGNAESKTNEFT